MTRPIVSVSRTASFSSAHRLHSIHLSDEENLNLFGKCNNPNGHGHNYKVTATVEGPVGERTGMVLNITVLRDALDAAVALLDHKHIDLDVPYFRDGKVVSTTENVCVFIWMEVKTRLGSDSALLHSVHLEETDKNSFTFKGHFQ